MRQGIRDFWSQLVGPGPLDVFIAGLHDATGISLTLAYWSVFAGMLVLALLLGRRPGPGRRGRR